MELLKLTDVSVGYEGKAVASHLSLALNEGDYLCIVGENGAGKSTLMKTLLNLRAPIEGSIVFSDAIARNEIGYLPQQTQVQRDFPATVWEVVLSGCLNRSGLRPFYTKAQKQTAEDWIARLDITDLKKLLRKTRRCFTLLVSWKLCGSPSFWPSVFLPKQKELLRFSLQPSCGRSLSLSELPSR